jgi:hypothetical protein
MAPLAVVVTLDPEPQTLKWSHPLMASAGVGLDQSASTEKLASLRLR